MINPEDPKYSLILGEGNIMSPEQIELCNFAAYGVGNAIVQSYAGSGKSKTIELMCASINPRKKILIIAFNRHIALHLKTKMKNYSNVSVTTYHSFGYKMIMACTGKKPELDEEKYSRYINDNISALLGPAGINLQGGELYLYRKNVERIVDLARYNRCQTASEIEKIIDKYGITKSIISNEIEAAEKLLKWGKTNIDYIDYADMIWLPYELHLHTQSKNFDYGYIFVDEAQDTSPVQFELIRAIKGRMTRIIAFGDRFQSINGWCGADDDAFSNFQSLDNTKQFKLNKSYRCSKAVCAVVQTKIKDFVVPETAKTGSVSYDSRISEISNGDLVLCRFTSPLIKLHNILLSNGKASVINGLSGYKELSGMVNNSVGVYGEEILNEYKRNFVSLVKNLAVKNQCKISDVVKESSVVDYYDRILSFESLIEPNMTKSQILQSLNDLFVNDQQNVDKETILLSTVHRAKGLEADHVHILCPSLMPSKFANMEWEKKSEENIIYVAWSRAKNSLNFISEKEFPSPDNLIRNETLKKYFDFEIF